MPNGDELIEQFRLGKELLTNAGLNQYEISNYAKPGFECRHHINCWSYGEYMGLGKGAASFVIEKKDPFKGKRWVNGDGANVILSKAKNLSLDAIKTRSFTSFRMTDEETITPEMAMNEFIMLGLRMNRGISVKRFNELFNSEFPDVKDLINEGWLEADHDMLRLTEKGQEIANTVIARLCHISDDFLKKD